jgi:hypothetical protein
MNDGEQRELTRDERAAIRKLVLALCANYDNHYKLCLPLDAPCYMLGKWWTGSYCKYFKNAVLPLDPALLAALLGGGRPETRLCIVCGAAFPVNGKRAYCSAACEQTALHKQKRDYMRKKRDGRGNFPR